MERLIPVVNQLQDVFATLGQPVDAIELPQIVVIGSQVLFAAHLLTCAFPKYTLVFDLCLARAPLST